MPLLDMATGFPIGTQLMLSPKLMVHELVWWFQRPGVKKASTIEAERIGDEVNGVTKPTAPGLWLLM